MRKKSNCNICKEKIKEGDFHCLEVKGYIYDFIMCGKCSKKVRKLVEEHKNNLIQQNRQTKSE